MAGSRTDALVSRAPKGRSITLVWGVAAAASAALFASLILTNFHLPEPPRIAAPAPSSSASGAINETSIAKTSIAKTSIAKTARKAKPVIQARLTPPMTSGAADAKPKIATGTAPETGRASWYDLASATASGETMDGDDLTAAHPSLPLGTNVLVENLDNGRSVIVRINDRGPFMPNRIIDVSKAAAEKLGMVADGVANVRVSRIETIAAGMSAPN